MRSPFDSYSRPLDHRPVSGLAGALAARERVRKASSFFWRTSFSSSGRSAGITTAVWLDGGTPGSVGAEGDAATPPTLIP